MRSKKSLHQPIFLIALFVIMVLVPERLLAHCDGMDGQVVKAAQSALATGNVNLVLIWVQNTDEGQMRKTFEQTQAVRKLSAEARELADQYFFETLVRVHRNGEGAPYTGLKPAGRDLGPAIPAADQALENRSADMLLKLLNDAVQTGIHEQFKLVVDKANFSKSDVTAGQAYVKTYVEFIHYVERVYEAAKNPAVGHFQEESVAQR